MRAVPPVFRDRFVNHNRHCWIAAILSLLGACVLWLVYGAFFTAIVLVLETVRTGDTERVAPPDWFKPVGLGVLALLFLWAFVDRWRSRYTPPSDRAVIGLHLVRDVLLLPARTTFAVWDYLTSRVKLSSHGEEQAWRLLQAIAELKKAPRSGLTYHVSNPDELDKLLLALQSTDWIDLHRGEEDWFYMVRSDQEEVLKPLLPEG